MNKQTIYIAPKSTNRNWVYEFVHVCSFQIVLKKQLKVATEKQLKC